MTDAGAICDMDHPMRSNPRPGPGRPSFIHVSAADADEHPTDTADGLKLTAVEEAALLDADESCGCGGIGGLAIRVMARIIDARFAEARTRAESKRVPLADEGWWSDKTIAEIIHEYAVVRGDLVAQYARDQLTEIIERRIADAIEDAREASDNADRWCAQVEALEAKLDLLLEQTPPRRYSI